MKKIIFLMFLLFSGQLRSYILLDNFEQDNDVLNTLWNQSGLYVNIGSDGEYLPDYLLAAKNGNSGALIKYLNATGVAYWNNFSESSLGIDLTTEDKLNFWIRAVLTNEGYPRNPRITFVELQGSNYSVYGRVDFSAYNGSSMVSNKWKEISIPVRAFSNTKAGGFHLTKVRSFILQFESDPGGGNIVLDDFEQNNGQNNSLWGWSGVYADPGNAIYYYPDVPEAARGGESGARIVYTNRSVAQYYNNFTEGAMISLTA